MSSLLRVGVFLNPASDVYDSGVSVAKNQSRVVLIGQKNLERCWYTLSELVIMRSDAMKRTATAKVESAENSEVFIFHFLILQSSCKDKTLREAAKNSEAFICAVTTFSWVSKSWHSNDIEIKGRSGLGQVNIINQMLMKLYQKIIFDVYTDTSLRIWQDVQILMSNQHLLHVEICCEWIERKGEPATK